VSKEKKSQNLGLPPIRHNRVVITVAKEMVAERKTRKQRCRARVLRQEERSLTFRAAEHANAKKARAEFVLLAMYKGSGCDEKDDDICPNVVVGMGNYGTSAS
jgi:hypothetical protein